LSRRIVKTSVTEKESDKETKHDEGSKKEIRRNSKGFERFEDYFSDDDDEDNDSSAEPSKKNSDGVEASKKEADKKSVDTKKTKEVNTRVLKFCLHYTKKLWQFG
jgi:hypothetical protein